MEYKIKDPALADAGALKIEWAESRMPVMAQLKDIYSETRPLEGWTVGGSMHVTKETAVLLKALVASGAAVVWSGCNPLSTQDDVAAALVREDIPVYAWHGMSRDEYYWALDRILDARPGLLVDDGADLIVRTHEINRSEGIVGATEETTTGIHRLEAMADEGRLSYPVIAVNNAETKWDFDNVYGTGQSSLDGILRSTNILLAGKKFVIAGYGHCGRGLAMRAQGMGASVIVTEVDPIRALKAVMDGFRVAPMDKAAAVGDIFITATGMKDIITGDHFASMKDGAVVCNTGHYDVEIQIPALEAQASASKEIRANNTEYTLPDGRRIYILAQGRLVNLASAEGHPSEVMDMSFANQFMALLHLTKEGKGLQSLVYEIGRDQDEKIAALKLESMGLSIDKLSEEQANYFSDFTAGT
jgi:adenosylhomocysteinase